MICARFPTMRSFVVLVLCISSSGLALSNGRAMKCDFSACEKSRNCRCSSAPSPINNLTKYPQLISIAISDAVSPDLQNFVGKMFDDVANPDGAPALLTFFVPHEYTNYQVVNNLYNIGHEIAVHSITRNHLQKYWREASVELLKQEFGGQRRTIAAMANIPIHEVIGVRTPEYQLAGNRSFEAYVSSGFTYDNTWPTSPGKPMFPYTLDYKSTQDCVLGTQCPNESFPGFWVLPINDLHGADGDCNNLGACNINGSAKEISDWLLEEVHRVRSTTKAPLTLNIDLHYFQTFKNSKEAFQIFLNEMQKLKDVFFVTQSQVIRWIKHPKTLIDFKTDYDPYKPLYGCYPTSCTYPSPHHPLTEVTMKACTRCPSSYPWVNNV